MLARIGRIKGAGGCHGMWKWRRKASDPWRVLQRLEGHQRKDGVKDGVAAWVEVLLLFGISNLNLELKTRCRDWGLVVGLLWSAKVPFFVKYKGNWVINRCMKLGITSSGSKCSKNIGYSAA